MHYNNLDFVACGCYSDYNTSDLHASFSISTVHRLLLIANTLLLAFFVVVRTVQASPVKNNEL